MKQHYTNEHVCNRCGAQFYSRKKKRIHAVGWKVAKEVLQSNFTLCSKCRRQEFAEVLIGNILEKTRQQFPFEKDNQIDLEIKQGMTELGTRVYKSQCFICNQGCDALVHEQNGKVVKIEGDKSSEVTKGILCCKGLAAKNLAYHSERLLHPLKRTGKRGGGDWQRIEWEEAIKIVAKNLRRVESNFGKDSIVLATGTSRGWIRYFMRFANSYGKQWMGPGIAQCFYPRMTGQILVLGGNAIENPHYEKTQCMLVWGCNPTNTWPVKGMGMMQARSRGAKLIVVDPVFSEAASKADLWMQLRPGTDAALALGFINVIINDENYDKEFVQKWCNGFSELAERAKRYPLKKVEEITWVPREKIVEAARLYATSRPASITQCLAIDQNADTISTSRAIAMIAAITGNIDIPGGNLFSMPMKVPTKSEDMKLDLLTDEHHNKRLGSIDYPLLAGKACVMGPSAHNNSVWNSILHGTPYPVKAIYCQGNNMVVSYGNTKKVTKALLALEFLVVVDLFMTDTAKLADIVLPAATWLERDAVTQNNDQTSINKIHLQQKVAQIGECWSDYKILNELAKELDIGEHMFATEEDYCDFLLKPSGMTFREFRQDSSSISVPFSFKKYERTGFKTPSGRVQLTDNRLERLGYDPLPGYREPSESPSSRPDLFKDYPLIITTGGRVPVYRHSELRNIDVLREFAPELSISLNPVTASNYDISDGDEIIVESARGSIEGKAYLTEGIDPRVIQVPSHWGGKHNVNLLMNDENCAPMIGSNQYRCQLCRIRRKS